MRIESIDKNNIVTLEFNVPMIVEHDPSNLNSTHLELKIEPYDEEM